jgi:class 3 adenylate cyclase
VALRVSRTTLLFTDLGASTALYYRRGDAVAFRLVQDHFELLRGIIESKRGTIVKTIGDSVMASFPDSANAFQAATEMSRAFHEFRAARTQAEQLSLKIGLYDGPCYMVTANGILDYFGQTVNIAARLQAQAKDDEIIVPRALGDRAQSEGWIDPSWSLEPYAAELKGIAEKVEATRIRRK